jgi:hypothetical protein
MNDINAACAGATFLSRSTSELELSIEERLAKLAELRSKGVIGEQEYISARQKIIAEV